MSWCVPVVALLALAACAPDDTQGAAKPASNPTTIAASQAGGRDCVDEPSRDDLEGGQYQRPRCAGTAATRAPRAYRVVGGSGDPVDQVVCDIGITFVLDGKLFGVELSGGVDGTYRFVRTPDIPGVHWTAGGRYHIEFPDGTDRPGTMTTEGGGTTTAGMTARATTGGERFALTPVAPCPG